MAGHEIEIRKGEDEKEIWTEVEPEAVELLEKYFQIKTQLKVEAKPPVVGTTADAMVQRSIIVDLAAPRWFASRKSTVLFVREFLPLGTR